MLRSSGGSGERGSVDETAASARRRRTAGTKTYHYGAIGWIGLGADSSLRVFRGPGNGNALTRSMGLGVGEILKGLQVGHGGRIQGSAAVTLDTCCGEMNASSRGEDVYFLYGTMGGGFLFAASVQERRDVNASSLGGSYCMPPYC